MGRAVALAWLLALGACAACAMAVGATASPQQRRASLAPDVLGPDVAAMLEARADTHRPPERTPTRSRVSGGDDSLLAGLSLGNPRILAPQRGGDSADAPTTAEARSAAERVPDTIAIVDNPSVAPEPTPPEFGRNPFDPMSV
jgi:hypothetical protein